MDLQTVLTPFPTLNTPRLILRALRMDDLHDLYEYASDPEIDRYTPWSRYGSLAEARADLAHYVQQYETGTMPVWGIEHRADRKLIGICNFRWHPHHRRAETGYTIARHYWGQGLAVEAVQAIITFGFAKMDLVRIEAVCMLGNTASERVMQKVGMQFEGVLHSYQIWRGTPQHLRMYAIVRPVT
jgi:ribosomal-protein-alanine N-acetyltransferase